MKHLALILMSALCLATPQAFAQSAEFKGHAELQTNFEARIMAPGQQFFWSLHVPFAMLPLLGSRSDIFSERQFKNGQPNSVNVLIYYMGLTSFAQEISNLCSPTWPTTNERPEFVSNVRQVCLWPSDAAKTDDVLQAFWLSIMGYDAPSEEYEAWRDFFLKSSYQNQPGAETVKAMALSLMMNPHFLLKK